MSNDCKIIRKRDGCLEDKDSGTVYVGSDINDSSVVVGGSNITVTPGTSGTLKCVSGGVEDICAQTTDPWIAAVLPQAPSKTMTPQSFPFFNYIVPITTISIVATQLIKEDKDNG